MYYIYKMNTEFSKELTIIRGDSIIIDKHNLRYSLEEGILNTTYKFVYDDDLNNNYLIHKILTKYKKNNFTEEEIYKIHNEYEKELEKCYICDKKIINPTNNYILCEKEECFNKQCETFIEKENLITNFYNKNPLGLELIYATFYNCLYSVHVNDILNPYPLKYITPEGNKCINQIKKILENIKIHDYMSSKTYDKEIYQDNKDIYYILKFLLLTNKTNFMYSKFKKSNDIQTDPKNIYDGTIQFDIIYDPIKEKEFSNSTIKFYLFHGSSISNWYSIMRNGIKNNSNTKFMSTGAAYGAGIYLSNDFNMSYGYSNNRTTVKSEIDDFKIVGVYQIKELKPEYNKSVNIFVIPDSSVLLLRHLIICRSSNEGNKINEYFTKQIYGKEVSVDNVVKVKNKRLLNELKMLEKQFENKIEISTTHDDSMIILNYKNYKLLLDDYPSNPPIVLRSIDTESSEILFIEQFTPKNWKIMNRISEILEYLNNNKEIKVINNVKTIDKKIIDEYNLFITKYKFY